MSSLRKAINDKCKECIYDSGAPGTWRQQVEACTSPSCPLYGDRPRAKIAKDRGNLAPKRIAIAQINTEAIPNYCSQKYKSKSGDKTPFLGSAA